ncbi:hypothetical protein CGLO_04121 [Colletotrichum gloeosporioides Cg-14]|uniref:Apple domain-containing protein n=1 Tax=Colletotrichum gloeosporioides (strain Cg-14) TaxID=1237896 RepID=T0KK35_COLGC|nr:hypothetical protein CGLO_04121 [Colletotrichum gloeosporioides Cg-14]
MSIAKTTLAFLWSSGSLLLASGLTQYPAEAPFRFISCVALSDTDLGSIFYPKAAGISPQACQQQCASTDSHFAALGSGSLQCAMSELPKLCLWWYRWNKEDLQHLWCLCLGLSAPSSADDDINNNNFEHSGLQQHGYIQFLYDRHRIQLIFHHSIHFRDNYRSCLHNIICNVIYTTVYRIINSIITNTVFSFFDNIIFDNIIFYNIIRSIIHCFAEWNLHGDRQRFDNNSFCVRDSRHFQFFKCFGFCSRHYQYTFFQFPEFCDHDDFAVDINLYCFTLFIEPDQKHKYNYRAPYHISAIFNDEFFFHYISHQPGFATVEFFRELKRHLQPAFTRRIFIGNSEFNCKIGHWHHFNTPIRPLQLIFWHFANSSVAFSVSTDILTRNTRIVVFCLRFNRNIWPVLDSIWKPILQRSGSIVWVKSGYTDCYTRLYCDVYHRLTSCIH